MAYRTIDFSTNITDADGSDGTIVVDGLKFTVTGAAAGYTFNLNGGRLNFSEATSNQQFVITVTETSGATFTLHDYTINYSGTPATGTDATGTWGATVYVLAGGTSASIPAAAGTFHYAASFPNDYQTASSMTIQDNNLGFDPALANPTSTFWLDDLVIQDTVPANAPPVVTAGAVAAYTEGGAAAVLDSGLTVTDADSTTLVSATVSITGGFLPGDALHFTNTANIIGGFDAVHGILTLAGADSVANYRAALASITFSSTSDNPTNSGVDTNRTISWDVDDGIAPSGTVTSTVTITGVNDKPVVTAGAVVVYTEGGAAAVLDPGLIVTDADNTNLTGATVSITGGFLAGDTLNFTNTTHITGSYDSVHGVLTLTGADTVANYQTALASITFSSTNHNPTNFNANTSRTISWTANDGTASNSAVTSTVNLTAVNDTPVVTAGAVAVYTEGGSAAVMDPGLTVTDLDNANLVGARVAITGGFLAGDVLNFTDTAHITGTYDASHGILTLTGSDSVANYQAALASITFSSTSHNPTNFGADTSRSISWIATDGIAPGSAVTSTVSITAVNEPPVVSNAIPDQGVAEDTAWSFQFAANAFTDVDSSLSYTATLGNGGALPSWLSFNAATRTFSGTPPRNFNGPIDLKVTASDGTAAVSDTFTLAVAPVNDAPVVSIQGTPDVVVGGDLVNIIAGFSLGIDVGVALNDGAGGLAAATGSPVSVSSTTSFFQFNVGVAVGDLDGDGRLDIAVSDAANNAVHVLLGDGHGGFRAGPVVAAGSAPWTVALGDFNNDGKLDIATGNVGADTLSVILADGHGGFSAPASIIAGSQPFSIALGDVNRDGYLDILVANVNGGGGPGSVTVALNDGHGGFSSTTTVPVVQDPLKIALGDLNRDGILDLVVASGLTAGTVDVLLGDGLGGFTRVPGAPFVTGDSTTSVALGDINGDGVLDIVAGNALDGNVSLFLGDGTGGFIAQAPLSVGTGPKSVALQDFNGDGFLDIVTLNAGTSVGVALNDGHGGFGAVTVTPIDAGTQAAANMFALGNLDNAQTVAEDTSLVFDAAHRNAITLSDPDANGGAETLTLTVLHGALTLAVANNLSIGSAGGSTIRVTGRLADINTALDGLIYRPDRDYNGTDTLTLALNDNGNSGGAALTANAQVPIDVTAVNDAPVLHDVPAGVAYSTGAVLALAPGLTLTDVDSATLASATVHVSAGAFTAHGDVLAVSAGGLAGTSILASYNAATETLTLSGTDTLAHYQQALEHVTFQTTNLAADRAQSIEWQLDDGSAAHNLSDLATTAISMPRAQVNDFNGSGHSAVLWQNTDGTVAIWSMNGTSLVSGSSVAFNPGPSWHAIGAGDFNGDGKTDILWQNADGTPAVWLMNGTSILSGANVGFNPGASWHVIGSGDFDGDGKADILWQNNNGQAAVWLMDGQTLKSGSYVGPNPGASWHVIGSGDFNGDGKADILWQNTNGQAAVWLMDGRTLLSGANVGFNPGSDWHVQAAADFNGDGKADILWQNANGQAAIWEMNGQNLISGSNVGINPGTSWQVHGTGDFNGDGKADIQWQNTDGTPAVWLMDGYNLVAGSNVGFDPGTSWHVVPQHHDVLV